MISLSGKTSDSGRAYALLKPEIPGESPEHMVFGFLPTLAEKILAWKGWRRPGSDAAKIPGEKILTPDELHAACQALLDPHIDTWGYRLVSAETVVAKGFAWLCDLDDVMTYYDGSETDELKIRAAVAQETDHSIIHCMLDMQVEFDKDLSFPGLVRRIHTQIDEAD